MGLTRIRAEQISNIDYKQSVRVIALENISLTGGAPAQVDGVNLSVNNRILVIGQNIASENGIYRVQTIGSGENGTWVRTTDANETGEIEAGMIVMVTEGVDYADSQWKLITNDPIIVGTTALEFRRNGAFEFGNIVANGTAILAEAVSDSVTFTAGDNISIVGNATEKSVTFSVTGISLNSIANGTSVVEIANANGNITASVNSNLIFTVGDTGVDVIGNINSGNIITNGQLGATDFIISGNITGNLLPVSDVTYDIGSPTQRWKDLYLSNSSIYLGNVILSASNNSLLIGEQTVITSSDTDSLTLTGNITGGNVSAATGNFTTVTGNGRAITSINADNIDTGTLSTDRLSGSYAISVAAASTAATVTTAAQPNITSVGTLTTLTVNGNTTIDSLSTRSQGEIRFFDSDNSNYVAFRSAGTVTGNVTWTLPATDGTVGQVLATDGAGNLAWATGGSGGGISWTTQANTPPVVAAPGDFWYDSANQIKYQYINDGTGNAWVDQSFPTVFETVTTGAIINSNANGVGNIGTSFGYFNTVFARATSAQYADLAEIYSSDADYAPGIVVVFGGTKEVTVSTEECDTRVAGVVSTNPAYMMNMGADGVMVALTGRVPCQVQGPVTKGDVLITSNIPGTAQRIGNRWLPGCVIGKSLETIEDDSVKTIEVAVGRF